MNEDILNTILQTVTALPPPNDSNNRNTRSSDLETKEKPEFLLNSISKKSINILGFDLYFDDILILAIILFLLQEEKKDYILIISLGLIFFNFSLDKLNDFEPLKNLLRNFS